MTLPPEEHIKKGISLEHFITIELGIKNGNFYYIILDKYQLEWGFFPQAK